MQFVELGLIGLTGPHDMRLEVRDTDTSLLLYNKQYLIHVRLIAAFRTFPSMVSSAFRLLTLRLPPKTILSDSITH